MIVRLTSGSILLWVSRKAIEAQFIPEGVQWNILSFSPSVVLFLDQLQVLVWFELGLDEE